MQNENQHQTEPFEKEIYNEEIFINPPKNKGFLRKNLKYGIGIIAFSTMGLLGAWIFRNHIAKNSIESYLKSRGIDAAIDIDELQLNNANFKKITLNRQGSKTVEIKNGSLIWHFEKFNQLSIDKLSANEAIFNFNVKDDGIDFGALEPFLKQNGKKSKTSIGKIDIENLKINFTKNKDVFKFNGKLNGDGNKNIIGGFNFQTANNIVNKPITIGIAISSLNRENSKIGFKILTNENDINYGGFSKFTKTNADIWGQINSQKSKSIKIDFFQSSLGFAQNINENLEIKNAKLIIKNGYIDLGNDFLKNGTFNLNSSIQLQSLKSGKNIIENLNSDLHFLRTEKFLPKIVAKGFVQNANFGTRISKSDFEASIISDSKDLSQILNNNFDGQFNLTIRNIENNQLKTSFNKFPNNSFANFINSPNLKLKAQVFGNLNNFQIKPIGPIELYTNAKESIKFNNIDDTSLAKIETQKGEIKTSLIAKGQINGIGTNGMVLSANLNGLNYNNNEIGVLIDNFSLKNADFDGKSFDVKINNAKFVQDKNKNINGKLIGNIYGDNQKFDGNSNFDLNIKNNILNFQTIGKFSKLNFANYDAKNLNFNIIGNGNLKTSFSLNGDVKFENIFNKESKILNGITRFKTQIFANNNKAISQIYGNFAKINSNKINSQNLEFNSNGVLGFKNNLNYNGNLNLQANNFNYEYEIFTQPKFNGDLNVSIKNNNIFASSQQFSAKIKEFKNKDLYIKNLQANGALAFAQNGNNIEINTSKCLEILFDDLKTGSNFMAQTDALLCPNNKGRLIAINNISTNIYAQTKIGASTLTMGEGINAPSINIAGLKGGFSSDNQGKNIFNGFADGFNIKFSTAPNEWAQIFAKNTDIKLDYGNEGTKINAKIANFNSLGLPVEIQGIMNGIFEIPNGKSPNAEFDLSNIIIKDKEKSPRFAPFELNGRGELLNQKLTIFGDANLLRNKKTIAQIYLGHNLNDGLGSVVIDASKLEFSPKKPISLDLDDIIPAAQGIFVNSIGPMAAIAKIEWSPNEEIKSSAKISTKDFGFNGTLLSMNGISGDIVISDLFKLKTPSVQNIEISQMNPGIPIIDGLLGFELSGDNSLDLKQVKWTLADGKLELKPVKIPFDKGVEQFEIIATNIDIEKLLKLAKVPNIEIEGKMSGSLPIFIKDNSFEIIGGKLLADGEGVFRYTGPSLGNETPKPKGIEKLKFKIAGTQKGGAELAIDALRDLRFKVLQIDVDGRLTGQMQFKILLEGSNPELLNGQIFRFNIKLDIPLGEIIERYNNIFNPKLDFLKPQ